MLKGKLEILVGISASGKSSYAHEKWLKDPLNTVIVSRDNIRQMFGFGEQTVSSYYGREDVFKLEKEVTKVFNTLVYDALESGKTVIADNTHLKRKFIEEYKYWNVETEFTLFPVTLKEALIRDMSRVRSVGEEVIQKQYSQFVNLFKDLQKDPVYFTPVVLDNKGREDCYVFDIDGCLADNCGTRSPFEWSKVGEDKPIESVMYLLCTLLAVNHKVAICSGRSSVCREETVNWLKDHSRGLFRDGYAKLFMRDENDFRPDWIVKQEMVQEICKTHTIKAWFDDRLSVSRHLKALGLKVFSVDYGNF